MPPFPLLDQFMGLPKGEPNQAMFPTRGSHIQRPACPSNKGHIVTHCLFCPRLSAAQIRYFQDVITQDL